jgi:hypothetical protein
MRGGQQDGHRHANTDCGLYACVRWRLHCCGMRAGQQDDHWYGHGAIWHVQLPGACVRIEVERAVCLTLSFWLPLYYFCVHRHAERSLCARKNHHHPTSAAQRLPPVLLVRVATAAAPAHLLALHGVQAAARATTYGAVQYATATGARRLRRRVRESAILVTQEQDVPRCKKATSTPAAPAVPPDAQRTTYRRQAASPERPATYAVCALTARRGPTRLLSRVSAATGALAWRALARARRATCSLRARVQLATHRRDAQRTTYRRQGLRMLTEYAPL